jgi:hypothetical protein
MTATADRFQMPEKYLNLLQGFAPLRGSELLLKGYIWAGATLLGYIAQAVGPAPTAEHSPIANYVPALVSLAGLIVLSVFSMLGKIYIKRLDVQTANRAQTSTDTALVIAELNKALDRKDAHCDEKLESQRVLFEKDVQHLRAEHLRAEDIFRKDRHKYRGRTQMCLSRLYILHSQGKITKDEAHIDFEEIEAANELQDIHTTEAG